MQLHAAMLFVKDLARMSTFYGEVLGLTPVDDARTDTYAEFDAGGSRVALHAIPPHIAGEIAISSPPRPREQNPVKLLFEVPDVERERARLEALGVTILIRPWGACDGIDPEGNVFGLRNGVPA
jgi:catechol 2,3-dioxygenase-like lactoylglutathione lyase family enzyme